MVNASCTSESIGGLKSVNTDINLVETKSWTPKYFANFFNTKEHSKIEYYLKYQAYDGYLVNFLIIEDI